jgi:hypothetical protein
METRKILVLEQQLTVSFKKNLRMIIYDAIHPISTPLANVAAWCGQYVLAKQIFC